MAKVNNANQGKQKWHESQFLITDLSVNHLAHDSAHSLGYRINVDTDPDDTEYVCKDFPSSRFSASSIRSTHLPCSRLLLLRTTRIPHHIVATVQPVRSPWSLSPTTSPLHTVRFPSWTTVAYAAVLTHCSWIACFGVSVWLPPPTVWILKPHGPTMRSSGTRT